MIELKPVDVAIVDQFAIDFKKRAKHFESIPDGSDVIGIYKKNKVIGYFVTRCYTSGEVEILQGYLLKEFRHNGFQYKSLTELEKLVKRKGFKKLFIASSRTLKAYTKFMGIAGYKPTRIIYSKEV